MVNNAGICFIGNVEIMSMEDIDKVIAVNFLGPLHVSRTFLPILRRGKGRIVNVASNAGKQHAEKNSTRSMKINLFNYRKYLFRKQIYVAMARHQGGKHIIKFRIIICNYFLQMHLPNNF